MHKPDYAEALAVLAEERERLGYLLSELQDRPPSELNRLRMEGLRRRMNTAGEAIELLLESAFPAEELTVPAAWA